MDAEELRFELRRWLCGRPHAAVDAGTIVAGLRLWGHETDTAEVDDAASYLAGLEPAQVKVTRSALGKAKHYQVTAAGIIAHGRNQ